MQIVYLVYKLQNHWRSFILAISIVQHGWVGANLIRSHYSRFAGPRNWHFVHTLQPSLSILALLVLCTSSRNGFGIYWVCSLAGIISSLQMKPMRRYDPFLFSRCWLFPAAVSILSILELTNFLVVWICSSANTVPYAPSNSSVQHGRRRTTHSYD